MIKPAQIPEAAAMAAARAIAQNNDGNERFAGLYLTDARAAIAAALNAWPDAFVTKYSEGAQAFNIPLPQEPSDD